MARDTTRRPIMGQNRVSPATNHPTYTSPIPTGHPTQCAPPSTQAPDPWIHPITQPTRYPQPLEYTTHSSCAAITTPYLHHYPYVYIIRLYRYTLHVYRPHTYPNRADPSPRSPHDLQLKWTNLDPWMPLDPTGTG